MRGSKVFFLVVALVVPALLFVFLKYFGKNEFAVEPLFTQGVIEPPDVCQTEYTLPYRVADSIRTKYALTAHRYTVLNYTDTVMNAAVRRVEREFSPEGIAFRMVLHENAFLSQQNEPETMLSDMDFRREKRCVFLLSEPNDLVLVDSLGTLYGQYDSHDLDEMDRLKAELLIVLKKY